MKRNCKKSFYKSVAVGFGLIALTAVSPIAYHSFSGSFEHQAVTEDTAYDSIIVFGGSNNRVIKGIEIFDSNDKQIPLFITDGNYVWHYDGLREYAQQRPINMTLDEGAWNTIDNAIISAEWLNKNSYRRPLLITSDYHMLRSVFEMHQSVGDDVFIISQSVSYDHDVGQDEWLKVYCRMVETTLQDISFHEDIEICYPLAQWLRVDNIEPSRALP